MKNILLFTILFTSFSAFSQMHYPITWTTSVNRISDVEYDLVATANIGPGWHLYAQSVPENGPISTSFTFEPNDDYQKMGNTTEGEGHKAHDPVFDMVIKYFERKATFTQRIKVKNGEATTVHAKVRFMMCNDTNCLPPKNEEIVFKIE